VGFVRNVMIGRQGLHRDVLLAAAADAGATDPVSHFATGNLTFSAPAENINAVVAGLEQRVEAVLGRHELIAVRSLDWLRAFVAEDLFAAHDTIELECEVSFLAPDAPPLDPARIPSLGRTVVVAARDRELAAARPRDGAQRPAANRLLERATGIQATARGWGTLVRVAAKG